MTTDDVLKTIEKFTVLELVELISAIETKFNVSATPPVSIYQDVEVVEKVEEIEQTEFSVVLIGIGFDKIKVIKTVREITGLALKESKSLIDDVPANISENLTKQEAEEVSNKLINIGATVEIR